MKIKHTILSKITASVLLLLLLMSFFGCEDSNSGEQKDFDQNNTTLHENDEADLFIDNEIVNIPADVELPEEVKEIIVYLFNVRYQSYLDAFSLENSKNTLLAKESRFKTKINNNILQREDERVYEVQRYYVLGSGTDYYANCNFDYHCDFYEQYTESDKLYIVFTECIDFTEADGTIATSIGIGHTLEFTNDGSSYFLNNDAHNDLNLTGTTVDENGLVTKGLLYPDDLDLQEIVSDPNYNKVG